MQWQKLTQRESDLDSETNAKIEMEVRKTYKQRRAKANQTSKLLYSDAQKRKEKINKNAEEI